MARPELKSFFIRHCFDATYVEVLLMDVYGIDDDVLRDIVFAKNVRIIFYSASFPIALFSEFLLANIVKIVLCFTRLMLLFLVD